MAPLPKRRHSTRRGGKRKAAITPSLPSVVKCPQCGSVKLPHMVCPSCGYYGGRIVITKKEKVAKKK